MKYLLTIFLITNILISMFSQNQINMYPTQAPITGKENHHNKATPYEALIEFYDAFNHRKMDLMANNWANTPGIAMDNPLGGIKRGWGPIKAVYQRIFEGQAEVYVEFFDYTIHQQGEVFYAVGRERGHFEVSGHRIPLAIRTSRIFQKLDGEWKQVHHHGSIEDPALLKSYQDLVRQ